LDGAAAMSAVLGVLCFRFFTTEFSFIVLVLRPVRCRDHDQILGSSGIAMVCVDQKFVYKLKWQC
jgi:hypothetical protein